MAFNTQRRMQFPDCFPLDLNRSQVDWSVDLPHMARGDDACVRELAGRYESETPVEAGWYAVVVYCEEHVAE